VILIERETSFVEEIQHWREISFPFTRIANVQAAGSTMVFVSWCGVLGVDTSRYLAVEVFQFLEARLDLIPTEGFVANESGPFLIVITSTDRVHSKVDSARAAQPFSSRIITFTVVGVFLRRGLVAPVHILVHEGRPSLSIDSEVAVFVGTSGFE
jgi:hypothetical protein